MSNEMTVQICLEQAWPTSDWVNATDIFPKYTAASCSSALRLFEIVSCFCKF